MNNSSQTIRKYAEQCLENGISPLQLFLSSVNDCKTGKPVSLISDISVLSTFSGPLSENDYLPVSDNHKCGYDLFKWGVTNTLKNIRKLKENDVAFLFISIHCPANIYTYSDFNRFLAGLRNDFSKEEIERLCFCFNSSLIYQNKEMTVSLLEDLRMYGIKSMLTDCAGEYFPSSKLVSYPLDYAILDKSVSYLVGNRNKPDYIPSLIGYYRSMGISVIIPDISNDEQRYALARSDCFGYIPSDDYSGKIIHMDKNIPIEEVINQSEEE